MRLSPRFFLFAALLVAGPCRAVAAGMPQLDFRNPYLLGQVFWGAVIFIGFYVVLSKSALPRIARVLDVRQARIQSDLDIARRAKADADRARQELLEARRDASDHAQANIQRIRETAKAGARAQAEATANRLEAQIAEAETQIVRSRENALAHLDQIAADTASSLVERLLGRHNPQMIQDAVRHVQR